MDPKVKQTLGDVDGIVEDGKVNVTVSAYCELRLARGCIFVAWSWLLVCVEAWNRFAVKDRS